MITNRGTAPLLVDLNGFIQQLIVVTHPGSPSSPSSPSATPSSPQLIEDQNPQLLKICLYVEKILSDGLRDVNFIGATLMWDFLQNITKCLPDTSRVVELAKDCSKTSIGRGRVFIRQCLNEGCLGDYLSALYFNQTIVKSYYREGCYLRDPDFASTFLSLLEPLAHIQFTLVVKDKDLDKQNYWDDITLSLLSEQKQLASMGKKQQPIQPPPKLQIEQQQQPSSIQPLNNTSNNQINNNNVNNIEESKLNSNNVISPSKQQQHNSLEIDINSLNDILDEIKKEDDQKAYEKLQQANQLRWDVFIDSLSRACKMVLLDYGGKGSPLTNQDKCIESFFITIDQILSADLYEHILNRWLCLEKLYSTTNFDNSIIVNIKQVYSNSEIRVKAWVYKSLNDTNLPNTINRLFSREETIKELYNQNSIFFNHEYRTKIVTIISDMVYKVQFNLQWDKIFIPIVDNQVVQPMQSISTNVVQHTGGQPTTTTKKVKIIKKTIKKITKVDREIQEPTHYGDDAAVGSSVTTSSTASHSDSIVHSLDNSETSSPLIGGGGTHISQIPSSNTQTPSHSVLSSSPLLNERQQNQQQQHQPSLNNSSDNINSIEDLEKQLDEINQLNNSGNSLEIDDIEKSLNSLVSPIIDAKVDIVEDYKPNVTLSDMFKKPLPPQHHQHQGYGNNNNFNSNNNSESTTIEPTKAIPRSSLLSNSHIGEYVSNLMERDELNHYDSSPSSSVGSYKGSSLLTTAFQQLNNNNNNNNNNFNRDRSNSNSSNSSGMGERVRSGSITIGGNNQYNNNVTNNSTGNNSGVASTTSSRKNSASSDYSSSSFGALYQASSNNNSTKDLTFVSPTYIPDNPYLSEALKMMDRERELQANNQNNQNNNNQGNNNNPMFSSSLPSRMSSSPYQLIISDYYSDKSDNPSIKKEKRNRYAGEDDTLFITREFKKPLLASDSAQLCPGCGANLQKLGFFKTRFCYYTGDWYCTSCHRNQKMCLPARILYHWDFKLYPVSDSSKQYITQNYQTPFDIFRSNPEVYKISNTLSKILGYRRKLHFINEYLETCRNKSHLDNLNNLKEYIVTENVHLYSLNDLERCFAGSLAPQIENLIVQYTNHITKTCSTCRGKGWICEFCNKESDLIFSWMKLDQTQVVQCFKCQSLSHRQCYNADRCPKCSRIAKIKAKQQQQQQNNVIDEFSINNNRNSIYINNNINNNNNNINSINNNNGDEGYF